MKMTTVKEAEHHLGEINRLLSYAESATVGKVVLLSGKDFRKIETHVSKLNRIMPFLGRWGA